MMAIVTSIGFILLSIWLITTGIVGLARGGITLSIDTLLSFLAIFAGIFILIGR